MLICDAGYKSYTNNGKLDKPYRVQRKRTKGWKMPENTLYVGRGSKWGNPYSVVAHGDIWQIKFMNSLTAFITGDIDEANKECIDRYRDYIFNNKLDISELKGKNLACWCKLSDKCHADVLLELANK